MDSRSFEWFPTDVWEYVNNFGFTKKAVDTKGRVGKREAPFAQVYGYLAKFYNLMTQNNFKLPAGR